MLKKDFIENFNDTYDFVGNFIQQIQAEQKKVVLFGTGYCLSLFIDLMHENQIEVIALCDNDSTKYGQFIHGIEVRSWDSLQKEEESFQVVISTSHFDEIKDQLRAKCFGGKIYHLPMEAYYKNTIYGKNFLVQHQEEFQRVYNLLADDTSKQVFINVLKHNISLDNRYYKEIEGLEITGYFGTELFHNQEEEIIIDGGAFIGDTLKEFFTDPTRKLTEYIAYEPDTESFEKLCQIPEQRLTAIPKGLGDKSDKMKFSAGMGVSSALSDEGNTMIEIDAIDHLLPERKITFIKMDIEGAEKAALYGAQKTIQSHRPTLAISAYHKKEDMYDLIHTILSINSDYRIYVRHTFYYQTVEIQPDIIIYAL